MQCYINPKWRKNIRTKWPDQRQVAAQHYSKQAGFTLVEVMIGTVLIAILVLGLSGLWTTVNNQFLLLTLKQKAIFVLNGEMERLTALYRITNFAANGSAFHEVTYNDASDGDDFSDGDAPSPGREFQRLVYSGLPQNFSTLENIVTTSGDQFNCPINTNAKTAQFNADCAGRVLVDENSNSTNDDRNYVWLDQQRRITGRLSWRIRDIKDSLDTFYPNVDRPCWDFFDSNGSNCKELTLYLHFPYRYSTAQEPDTDAGFGRRETLLLKTFVARR